MQDKVCVLGVEQVSWVNRAGETVERCDVFYFKPEDFENTRMFRGFKVLRLNVHPTFSGADFERLPAHCGFNYTLKRGKGGKPEPQLVEISRLGDFQFQNRGFLVLGAKPYDFESDDGKLHRGVKLFFLDTEAPVDSEGSLGLLPIEASYSKPSLAVFQTLPGYYQLDLDHVRGRGGDVQLRIKDLRFEAPYQEAKAA